MLLWTWANLHLQSWRCSGYQRWRHGSLMRLLTGSHWDAGVDLSPLLTTACPIHSFTQEIAIVCIWMMSHWNLNFLQNVWFLPNDNEYCFANKCTKKANWMQEQLLLLHGTNRPSQCGENGNGREIFFQSLHCPRQEMHGIADFHISALFPLLTRFSSECEKRLCSMQSQARAEVPEYKMQTFASVSRIHGFHD